MHELLTASRDVYAELKNLKTDVREELAEKIKVREGDREIKITKQRALIKSVVARALKGNDRAASKLLDILVKLYGIEDVAADAGVLLTEDEQKVMENVKARILRQEASQANRKGVKS